MKHKVLCIDDESHNLEALERLLRKDYDVTTAISGADAVKHLADHKFSLIISDQKMPEMTGVQFFEIAQTQQPEAIRILLTGYTDLESVIAAINQGHIYRYVTKPWDPQEFMGTVKQGIDVFEMRTKIKQQNEELKSLDKLKSDFMVLVNHELKTPLTGIFSFVQLLKEEKLEPEPTLYLQKIETNTQRLQDLINDTLLITRLQSQDLNLSRESVDVNEVLQTTVNELSKNYSKNLSFDFKTTGNFPVNINREYLQIILRKLVLNSLQHSQPDTTIRYGLQDQGNQWRLVTENQSQKPLGENTKVLIEAFQTSGPVLNHAGGTGLGLAVIKAVAQLFNGQMDLVTEENNFFLSLTFPKN